MGTEAAMMLEMAHVVGVFMFLTAWLIVSLG